MTRDSVQVSHDRGMSLHPSLEPFEFLSARQRIVGNPDATQISSYLVEDWFGLYWDSVVFIVSQTQLRDDAQIL